MRPLHILASLAVLAPLSIALASLPEDLETIGSAQQPPSSRQDRPRWKNDGPPNRVDPSDISDRRRGERPGMRDRDHRPGERPGMRDRDRRRGERPGMKDRDRQRSERPGMKDRDRRRSERPGMDDRDRPQGERAGQRIRSRSSKRGTSPGATGN